MTKWKLGLEVEQKESGHRLGSFYFFFLATHSALIREKQNVAQVSHTRLQEISSRSLALV